MAQMPAVCSTCTGPVNAVFNPSTGTRDSITLTSQVSVSEQCFVRDTIEFLNGGQLVFVPVGGRYFDNYNVVCRKLVITGGSPPNVKVNPCGPDDPGSNYTGNNVITWESRLKTAAHGPGFPTAAPDGGMPPPPGNTPFDPNNWEDRGQGNDGLKGERGKDGSKGNDGDIGADALNINTRERRPVLNVVALEVVFSTPLSHLTIDWDGQVGGNGGKGQNGGRGGDGMGGRDGLTDTDWADSCERPPGNGGDSGDGGDGGRGGDGGKGGNAGDIYIVSTAANVSPGGAFKAGQVTYVNGGATGGNAGDGGRGGRAGTKVGRKGAKTSACDAADHDGQVGNPGIPDPVGTGGTVPGSPGAKGNPGSLRFEVIAPPSTGTCADLIPTALSVSGITPNNGAKGTTVPVVISGVGFDAAVPANNQVQVSGPGVTAGVPSAATATTINCSLTIASVTLATARDVTVTVALTNSATLVGGFTVV